MASLNDILGVDRRTVREVSEVIEIQWDAGWIRMLYIKKKSSAVSVEC